MRIAIVGAGALGRIYGVRLAEKHDVTYVVRASRVSETRPLRIESALPFGAAREQASARRADHIPEGTDVAIVTLRFDNVTVHDRDLARVLAAPAGTMVVVLSPVFPAQRADMEEVVGHPVVPAMPGVSGYEDERGVVRHWVPPGVPTCIDDGLATVGVAGGPIRELALRTELVRALEGAGLPARLEPGVEARNAATTTSFFPLIASVAVAGDVAHLAADAALITLVRGAIDECGALAARLGEPAPWASVPTSLFGPWTLEVGASLARRIAPEVVRFVDLHFGPKLRDQHRAMGRHLLHLADGHGTPSASLRALVGRLDETHALGSDT